MLQRQEQLDLVKRSSRSSRVLLQQALLQLSSWSSSQVQHLSSSQMLEETQQLGLLVQVLLLQRAVPVVAVVALQR
jgi:hypothetical protein